jgi:hypothetical protein
MGSVISVALPYRVEDAEHDYRLEIYFKTGEEAKN